MTDTTPSQAFLTDQVRWVMGRGVPAQEAEDLVVRAWEKASATYQPSRGPFSAYLRTVIRNDTMYWWRDQARKKRAHGHLTLIREPADTRQLEIAASRQTHLLEALTPEERAVFHAWALQKHLGRDVLPAEKASRTLALSVRDYENAKRRLKARLQNLLHQLGWTAREVIHGDEDVERTG